MGRKLFNKSKKGLFVSHCSADNDIMSNFSRLLNKYYDSYTVFNTYDYRHSTYAGEDRSDALRKRLSDSDLMIAIITDSYLRSTICISELSSFWYADKRVIPIVFNGDNGIQFLKELFGKDIIHIDTHNNSGNPGHILTDAMQKSGFGLNDSLSFEAETDFDSFFSNCKQSSGERGFIGMSDEEKSVLDYCNSFGIHQFKNRGFSSEAEDKLDDKEEIIVLSTTGANLISMLSSEFLPSALQRGVDFTLLLPNKCSQFVTDVAEIEMPLSVSANTERLNNEFNNVIINLCSVVKKVYALTPSQTRGHVYIGNAFTLLRQTVVLGRKDDEIWGWTSLTIPPKRTNDGTPSFEFSGSINERSMAKIMWEHLSAIKAIAQNRENSWIEILPETDADKVCFGLEPYTAKKEWQSLYSIAKTQSEYHKNLSDKILVEVAAQHPLNPDGTPKMEFAKRLDAAVDLYGKLKSEGYDVQIFIPGSIHRYKGVVDSISLSQAGVLYLERKGIPTKDLLGENEIEKYKGKNGVYNSADECFVASEIYKSGDYKDLYCLCSPNQLVRKQLFYIAFGVVPLIISVPCNEMAHDFIYELFETIPDVIMRDHTWQDGDSLQGNRTRKERNPLL